MPAITRSATNAYTAAHAAVMAMIPRHFIVTVVTESIAISYSIPMEVSPDGSAIHIESIGGVHELDPCYVHPQDITECISTTVEHDDGLQSFTIDLYMNNRLEPEAEHRIAWVQLRYCPKWSLWAVNSKVIIRNQDPVNIQTVPVIGLTVTLNGVAQVVNESCADTLAAAKATLQ